MNKYDTGKIRKISEEILRCRPEDELQFSASQLTAKDTLFRLNNLPNDCTTIELDKCTLDWLQAGQDELK